MTRGGWKEKICNTVKAVHGGISATGGLEVKSIQFSKEPCKDSSWPSANSTPSHVTNEQTLQVSTQTLEFSTISSLLRRYVQISIN